MYTLSYRRTVCLQPFYDIFYEPLLILPSPQ